MLSQTSTEPAASTGVIQSPATPRTLRNLQLLDLNFSHHFEQPAELPAFKGGVWHGVFGLALKEVDEAAFRCLFSTTARSQPWRLIAPRDTATICQAGQTVSATVTLFNEAIEYTHACAEAIVRMGTLGFGRRRSIAAVQDISGHIGHLPKPLHALLSLPDATQCGLLASEIFEQPTPVQNGTVGLHLVTPLSLKQDGATLRVAPCAEAVIRRVLGRLVALVPVSGEGFLSSAEKLRLLQAAAAVQIFSSNVQWCEWERYSGRQKSTMLFGGLAGELIYVGDPHDTAVIRPWLNLAQRIGLGSKTSFGLGQLRVADFAFDT